MQFLNLDTTFLHAPEFIGSEPVERATWLAVITWSAGQENGGRIVGARGWKDRQWQQTCGVTTLEVNAAGSLLKWDGDDLLVWRYPIEQQRKHRSNRRRGRKGGRAKTEAKTQAAHANGANGGRPKKTQAETEAPNPSQNPTERNGTEGKGKDIQSSGAALPRSGASEPRKPPAESKPRDPLFDALALSTGSKPEELTRDASRVVAVALADIRKVAPDLVPLEITRRAENYRRHFRDAALTPFALAKHWAVCDNGPRNVKPDIQADRDRAALARGQFIA